MSSAMTMLLEHPDVKEMFKLMSESTIKIPLQEYTSLLQYVDAIENQYNSMLAEFAELKTQVSGIKDNPILVIMEYIKSTISYIGEVLNNIKESIIAFTKNALETIKEKGLSALNSTFDFLKVKDGLVALSAKLEKATDDTINDIKSVDAISREYHKVGNSLANIGKLLIGREASDEIKPNGKLSGALQWSLVHIKNGYETMTDFVNGAIKDIEKLEKYIEEKAQSPQAPLETENSPAIPIIPTNFENLSQDELQAVYTQLLEKGMNGDLTTDENIALQKAVEEIEAQLPHTEAYDAAEALETEQGAEM